LPEVYEEIVSEILLISVQKQFNRRFSDFSLSTGGCTLKKDPIATYLLVSLIQKCVVKKDVEF